MEKVLKNPQIFVRIRKNTWSDICRSFIRMRILLFA